MSEILRIMPNSFAGFSREDAEKELTRIEAERLRMEAERAAAEKKRLEDLARGNAGKGNVAPVNDVSGLDGVVFGASSAERLNQPDAVRFAAQHGILQSAGEAVYARKVLNDPASREAQRTRTGAIYVVENGKAFVTFDDIADATKNVVLRYADEGCNDNKDDEEFIIRRSLLASVLERAKDTHCFLPVPDNGMIGTRVDSDAGMQVYANSPYVIAVLGKEIAKVNAELISDSNCVVGMMNLLASKWVEANVADGEGLVRLVSLAERPHIIRADQKFNNLGRARWVTYDSGGSK